MLPLNQLEALLPDGSEVEDGRRRACIEGIGWQEGGGGGGGGGGAWVAMVLFPFYCELL